MAAVGLHDLVYVAVDEVVEGIQVLLHQPPHLIKIEPRKQIKIFEIGNGREIYGYSTLRKAGMRANLSTGDFIGSARDFIVASAMASPRERNRVLGEAEGFGKYAHEQIEVKLTYGSKFIYILSFEPKSQPMFRLGPIARLFG